MPTQDSEYRRDLPVSEAVELRLNVHFRRIPKLSFIAMKDFFQLAREQIVPRTVSANCNQRTCFELPQFLQPGAQIAILWTDPEFYRGN